MPRRVLLPNRVVTVLLLCLCLAPVGMLAACGDGSERESAEPLQEAPENDVPLDPPTLRFQVSAAGVVGAAPELEAEAGEVVVLVLENDSDTGYELSVLGPDEDDAYALEAAAGASEGGRFMPRDVGSHVVAVYPVGRPDAAEEFLLDVTDT